MKEAQNESVKWNRFAAVTNREEVAFRKNLKIELILSTESTWTLKGGNELVLLRFLEKVLDLGNKFKLHDLSIATKKFEDRLDGYDEKIKISKFRHQRRMSLGRFMRETKFKKENQRMQKLANTIARTDDLIDALSDHMLEMEVFIYCYELDGALNKL